MEEMDEDLEKFYNCTGALLERYSNGTINLNLQQVKELVDSILNASGTYLFQTNRRHLRDVINICMEPLPHDLLWWQKLIWGCLFAFMLLIATGGNLIVMWIVLAHRRMRTVTNYFLVNLSVSDLLMSLLNCICNFIFMINSNWPFGAIYCTLNNFVSSVTVAANVFTLMAISLDRYMAIVRPLQHRKSHAKARITLAVIWIASGLLATPFLLYSTTKTQRYQDGQIRIACYVLWPDGSYYPNSVTDYVYNIIFLAVTYLIPMIVMAVCYTLMGKELWGSRSIGELTQRQMDSISSKKKVVRMFILVVAIFGFCWLPYHVYFICVYHNDSISRSSYVQHVYLAFYWLAMSNAMVNPIIYYWMNKRFRIYFQRAICLCCCWGLRSGDDFTTPTLKRIGSQSELARSRSEDRTRHVSVYWRRRTQHTFLHHRRPVIRNKARDENVEKNGTVGSS